MLPVHLPERLMFNLRILARDHGEPHVCRDGFPGVRITLELTQDDIAELLLAWRPGMIESLGAQHYAVTARGLARPPLL